MAKNNIGSRKPNNARKGAYGAEEKKSDGKKTLPAFQKKSRRGKKSDGELQREYNDKNGIVPKTIKKQIVNTLEITKKADRTKEIKKADIPEEIEKLKALMKIASQNLDFERCIEIRDTIAKLKLKMRK